MPFDGRTYGSLPLISPISHHPLSNATGEALGDCMRASYMHARSNARLIAHRTFQTRPITESFGPNAISDTTWHTVSSISSRLPEGANIVGARLAWTSLSTTAINMRCRVQVTIGGDTDIGDESLIVGAAGPSFVAGQMLDIPILSPYSLDDPSSPATGESTASVELSTVVPSGMAEAATILVQAYAVDDNGNAATFAPRLVTVWWRMNG